MYNIVAKILTFLILIPTLASCDGKESKQKSEQKNIEVSKNSMIMPAASMHQTATDAIAKGNTVAAPNTTESVTKAEPIMFVKDHDMILGNKDSKVVMIEYFSFTCTHCAYFHKQIYPKLKQKYVDTNKIAYVLREFLGNKQDMDAAVLARCSGIQFFKFVDTLLLEQDKCFRSKNYREVLTNIGQLGGVSPESYAKCLNNDDIIKPLIDNTRATTTFPKFIGTPSFFINGKQYTGLYSEEKLSEALDEALKNSLSQ